jgi:hypothetical protein
MSARKYQSLLKNDNLSKCKDFVSKIQGWSNPSLVSTDFESFSWEEREKVLPYIFPPYVRFAMAGIDLEVDVQVIKDLGGFRKTTDFGREDELNMI